MNVDMKYALVGLLFGVASLAISLHVTYGIGLAITITVSCLVYSLLETRKPKSGTCLLPAGKLEAKKPSLKFFLILTGIIITFFLISISSFLYKQQLIYFIVVALLSALIAVEIGVLNSSNNSATYCILLQILILAAVVRWSPYFAFPGFMGVDPWVHSFGVQHILDRGYVFTDLDIVQLYNFIPTHNPLVRFYSSFPNMHILISEVQLLNSFPSLKHAFAFSIGLFEILSILFVFIMADRIFLDRKRASLASLLVAMSNWHIRWGWWIIPMTMGLAFFALLLYLCPFDYVHLNQRKYTAIFFFVFAIIVLTHTISTLIVVVFLGFLWIHKKMRKSPTRPPSNLLFLTIVTLLAQWIFSHFIEIRAPFIFRTTSFKVIQPTHRSLVRFEIDHIGINILYFFTILGGLNWLKKLSIRKVSILAGAFGLVVFIYGSVLTGAEGFLPHRWMSFLFVLLAPVAADGYHFMARFLYKRKKVLLIGSFCFIFIFTTVMMISAESNIHQLEGIPRQYFKESELMAARVATSVFQGNVYVDERFTLYFKWFLRRKVLSLDLINFNPNAINGLVVIRRVTAMPNDALERALNKTNKVYSNGEVFLLGETS